MKKMRESVAGQQEAGASGNIPDHRKHRQSLKVTSLILSYIKAEGVNHEKRGVNW
jgi:hypothetical protein